MNIRTVGDGLVKGAREVQASQPIIRKVKLEGKPLTVCVLPTHKYNLVTVTAKNGFVGCGYYDIEAINAGKENAAIVTGVNSYDDVLKANVVKVSDSAANLGIKKGMTGREVLLKLS